MHAHTGIALVHKMYACNSFYIQLECLVLTLVCISLAAISNSNMSSVFHAHVGYFVCMFVSVFMLEVLMRAF